jgi:hypothetical protein
MMPWMKKFGRLACFRIDSRQIGTFVQITVYAGKSQIIQIVVATVDSWDNVLYVQQGQG